MPASSRRSAALDLAALVGVVVVVAVSIWCRWPGFVQGGFASHDVAGMLYNAMVLHRGGLPYVDTVELKAPGGFWLAAWLAGPQGRDIATFQVWANAAALLSLLAVGVIGWRTWGRGGAVVAMLVYALHDAHLDSMDANYVTWANLPQIVAIGLALEATRARAGARAAAWLGAGLMCGAAASIKQQDGAVALAVLVLLLWPAAAGRSRRRDGVAFAAGLALSALPWVVRYALAGQLSALSRGFLLNPWGLRYVFDNPVESPLREGVLASTYFLALALALAAFSVARAGPAHWRGPLLGLVAWALATGLAAALGGRFYKGYFLACAAPLALIAAAPWGLLGAMPLRPRALRVCLLLAVLGLAVRAGASTMLTRADRWRSHDEGGRTIAAHIARESTPDDTIWVWGWHLWDVYPLADRMSASRIYKSLGVLTPPNDDSWRRPASPLVFVDGPYADMLLEDLTRNRPRWIVLGSTVPHREFSALQELLRASYRRDRSVRIGRVQMWRLREDESRAQGGP